MNLAKINNLEYPDRSFDNADWVKVLPVVDHPLQASELIEMQSLMQKNLEAGLTGIINDGFILSGLEIRELDRNPTEIDLVLNPGKLLIEGLVIEVPGANISVPLTRESILGVLVTTEVVDYLADPNLRNPANGGAEYGDPGASRLVYQSTIVVDEPNAYPLYKVNAQSIAKIASTNLKQIDQKVESYIFERNGNFVVEGLKVNLKSVSQASILEENNSFRLLTSQTEALEAEVLTLGNNNLNLAQQLQELETQILAARTLLSVDSSSNNQLNLTRLEIEFQQVKDKFDSSSLDLATEQLSLNKVKNQLKIEQNLYANSFNLTVDTGIAYILGKRIAPKNPIALNIPIDIKTQTVEDAVYVYRGREIVYFFDFILSGNPTWADIDTENITYVFEFNNIRLDNELLQIKLTAPLTVFKSIQNPSNDPGLIFDSNEFLDLLATEFNSVAALNPALEFSEPQAIYTQRELKQLIKSQVKLSKNNQNSLGFAAVTTVENNSIFIELDALANLNNSLIPSNFLTENNQTINLINNIENRFGLGFKPVVKINRLVIDKLAVEIPIVRGAIPGTVDNLPDDTIIEIVRVYQPDKEYLEGRDYTLVNQFQIDWSLDLATSIEPGINETYYVDFFFTKVVEEGKDFEFEAGVDEIYFTNETPALNKTFRVSYQYQTSQLGVIYLTNEGRVNYLLSPAESLLIPNIPTNTLELATLNISGSEITVIPSNSYLPSWGDIKRGLAILKDNHNTLKTLNLNYQLREIKNQLNLDSQFDFASILSEFVDLDLADSDFTAVFSPTSQGYTLPAESKDLPLIYIEEGKALKANNYLYNIYGELNYLVQDRLTKAHTLSVAVTDKAVGKLIVTPNLFFYNQSSEFYTSCDPIVSNSSLIGRVTLDAASQDVRNSYISLGEEVRDSIVAGNACVTYDPTLFPNLDKTTQLKPVTLNLKAVGLEPNRDGFEVFLSGKRINSSKITRLNNTPAGFLSDFSLKSKDNGEIEIRIELDPQDVSLGCHLIELKSISNYCATKISLFNNFFNRIVINSLKNWSLDSYNQVADKLLPINNLPVENDYLETYSNLIQTFKITETIFTTGIKLKLKSAQIDHTLNVYLYEQDDLTNLPGRNLIGIAQADNLLPDSSGNTWTEFKFSQPVILKGDKEYAIGLETNQPDLEVFCAELNQPDLLNQFLIGNQLNFTGKLYRSLDSLNLELIENEKLTFIISRAEFDTEQPKIINLGRYGTDQNVNFITSFALNSRDIILNDTELTYQYRLNTSLDWQVFEPNVSNCFPKKVSNVFVRAIIKSNNSKVSPVLPLLDSSITIETNQPEALILSKIKRVNPYKKVVVLADVILPPGSNLDISFSSSNFSDNIANSFIDLVPDPNFNQTLDSALNISRIKFDYEHQTNLSNLFKYKIKLSSNDIAQLPLIRNLYIYLT